MQNIEPKSKPQRIDVAVGVVFDSVGRILIAQRKADSHQGGLWEFPGGKFELNEDVEQALGRELSEELGIKPIKTRPLIKLDYSYPDVDVRLHVVEVNEFSGDAKGREGQPIRWVSKSELYKYTFPKANKVILSALKVGRQYAIINIDSVEQVLSDLVGVAEQGVRLVQLRAEAVVDQNSKSIAESVAAKCAELNVICLFNSRIVGVSNGDCGLHLTSRDLMVLDKRPIVNGFVAASCHSKGELKKAEELGLDFVVLSPVKKTKSHPEVEPLGWQRFKSWVNDANIPVYALGGMCEKDMEMALSCGAQGLAGIGMYQKAE